MKRACIAIVDALRARIYTYEQTARDGAGATGALREVTDLVNPGRRGHDLYSTTKPGIKRSSPGGGTTDDHRDAHVDELDRRFARQVIAEIDRIAREQGYDRVLIVASPAMLGELRGVAGSLRRPELEVDYIARDLAQLTSPQIHDHLAQLRLVAPRRAVSAAG
ncbi:MAG: host attachment protein [Deltaproteobacteria bacterium]|nr:MAG: host attachment protein [Deltaproteobacteria bacterium]TMQ22379.1 MAG: host attachment protein [Deltaproteobacteria bacterium]